MPSRGFSLIELLAAAAILGVLASVAVPFVETAMKRQKEQALRIALRDIRQGLDAYKQAVAAGRIVVDQSKSGYPPSLTELAGGVADEKDAGKRKMYFLRRIPRDPFNTDSSVPAIKSWGLRSYGSSDEHPAEGDDVFDVYSTSKLTGLNGVPYREW
jgi:general secretion pathway protein G